MKYEQITIGQLIQVGRGICKVISKNKKHVIVETSTGKLKKVALQFIRERR